MAQQQHSSVQAVGGSSKVVLPPQSQQPPAVQRRLTLYAETQFDELGRVLTNLFSSPAGLVCFFPSYQMCEDACEYWRGAIGVSGGSRSEGGRSEGGVGKSSPRDVWKTLMGKKRIFREPKTASEVDMVLRKYSKCAQQQQQQQGMSRSGGDTGVGSGGGGGKLSEGMAGSGGGGAALFCVMGGKLSEGINFSDDLARCVVVVGMPYPNVKDPELLEKRAFLNSQAALSMRHRQPSCDVIQGGSGASSICADRGTGNVVAAAVQQLDTTAGDRYYEALCLRSVNQSIGRAIRHINDFSAIVLVDARYGSAKVQADLPDWIRSRLTTVDQFASMVVPLKQFYRDHAKDRA